MTPCEELGYKVGDKFEVLAEHDSRFAAGGIVELIKDDGSEIPLCANDSVAGYCHLEDLKPLNQQEEQPNDQEDRIFDAQDTIAAHDAAEYMQKSGLGHAEAQRRISDLKRDGLVEYSEKLVRAIEGLADKNPSLWVRNINGSVTLAAYPTSAGRVGMYKLSVTLEFTWTGVRITVGRSDDPVHNKRLKLKNPLHQLRLLCVYLKTSRMAAKREKDNRKKKDGIWTEYMATALQDLGNTLNDR